MHAKTAREPGLKSWKVSEKADRASQTDKAAASSAAEVLRVGEWLIALPPWKISQIGGQSFFTAVVCKSSVAVMREFVQIFINSCG